MNEGGKEGGKKYVYIYNWVSNHFSQLGKEGLRKIRFSNASHCFPHSCAQ